MKFFGIAGHSGMGKTTLLERLVTELSSRGLVVSLIKHSHKNIDIDRPGKDSYRLRESGCKEVLLLGNDRWALMHELRGADEPPTWETCPASLSSCCHAPSVAEASPRSFRFARSSARRRSPWQVRPGAIGRMLACSLEKGLDMTAFNVVRFRVKTGERSYCMIGEWDSFDELAAARPRMIGLLDSIRADLEDLGGGLGVTDPVSGEVVVEMKR
jgi:hypothetical protein